MEEKVEISMEVLTFLERKNKHNNINGFKFQYLPLNYPLNILVKITILSFHNIAYFIILLLFFCSILFSIL